MLRLIKGSIDLIPKINKESKSISNNSIVMFPDVLISLH